MTFLPTMENQKVAFLDPWPVSSGSATYIPMNPDWTAIGVQVSGGMDSAILLYMTAKTIERHNLNVKIMPFSIEIYDKAKNLDSARAVISKVKELVNLDVWLPSVESIGTPEESFPPGKDKLFDRTFIPYFENGSINFEISGVTRNPPKDMRDSFSSNINRVEDRDDPPSIYIGVENACAHALIDKKDVVEHYINLGLLDEIVPLTLSCDEQLSVIKSNGWTIPCNRCWWCEERKWALEYHGLDYLRYSPQRSPD